MCVLCVCLSFARAAYISLSYTSKEYKRVREKPSSATCWMRSVASREQERERDEESCIALHVHTYLYTLLSLYTLPSDLRARPTRVKNGPMAWRGRTAGRIEAFTRATREPPHRRRFLSFGQTLLPHKRAAYCAKHFILYTHGKDTRNTLFNKPRRSGERWLLLLCVCANANFLSKKKKTSSFFW